MSLSTNEMDWVAEHLGHSIDVQKNYYRMMSTTIEKTKIAKLLILADNGTIDQYKGKRIEDIEVEGNNVCFGFCAKILY